MATNNGAESSQCRIMGAHFEKKLIHDKADKYYRCLISDTGESACRKPINGKKKWNLVAHAKTHIIFFRENYGNYLDRQVNVAAIRLEFIQNCAELVAVNDTPFHLFSKSGFLKMNKEKLQKLKDVGCNHGLGAPAYSAIKEHIHYLATEIFNEIRSEANGKFLSVMDDGASKYQRSILGIYLQYMVDSRIVIRCVGTVNLTSKHTGVFLATTRTTRNVGYKNIAAGCGHYR